MAANIGEQFLAEARWRFEHDGWKIRRCLEQMTDDELGWRPNDASNSVATIIVHVCGSVSQWMSVIAGTEHERNRDTEFAPGSSISREDLLTLLDKTLQAAIDAIDRLDPAKLGDPVEIQGFKNSYLTAIYGTERHLAEHIGQIAYIAKIKRGPAFQSLWVPQNEAQAASPYGHGFHPPGLPTGTGSKKDSIQQNRISNR